MKLIILGPQGCGKGTQAKIIATDLGIPHISSGDLFRENIKQQTPLGLQAKTIMDKGDLVPDQVTNSMVKARLSKPDCANGFILDGYPRNIDQLKELLGYTDIDKALDVEISDDEAIKRVSGRLVCTNCGAGFHINFKKPEQEGVCDKCGGALNRRTDDEPEAIIKRLDIYHEKIKPIIEFLKEKGLLTIVNGSQSIEEVTRDIKLMLRSKF
ncbi:MAG: adenylate kinase [Nanoarchaeota archaeon]|nr:adenylate kinase [Nanoarchaeota archaeon]